MGSILKRSASLLCHLLLLLCLFPCYVSSEPIKISGEALPGLEAFDDAMLKLMEENSSPGGSLAVAYKGKLILARSYGFTSKDKDAQPVQPDSQFRFCSLSKVITSTAIMLLVQSGKLKLDDTMVDALRDDAPKKMGRKVGDVTIQHLLNHRAGFPSNQDNDPMFAFDPACPNHLSGYLEQPLQYTPGEKYSYSNLGFCILGRIVEKVSGKSYQQFVQENILNPVGAKSIEPGLSKERKPKEVSYYTRGRENSEINMQANLADGGWIGNAIDYLRFFLSIDGRRQPGLLSNEALDMMLKRPSALDLEGKPVFYANGLLVRDLNNGKKNFFHSGSLPGVNTFAASFSNGITYVALLNTRISDGITDRELSAAMGKIKKIPAGDLFEKY